MYWAKYFPNEFVDENGDPRQKQEEDDVDVLDIPETNSDGGDNLIEDDEWLDEDEEDDDDDF